VDGGVVDQNIQAAVAAVQVGGDLLDAGRVGNVQPPGQQVPVGGEGGGGGLLGLGEIAGGENDGVTSNWTFSLPFGEGGYRPAAALVPTSAVLHAQKGQFPGFGSSIRRSNPAGTSETTTVTRSTLPIVKHRGPDGRLGSDQERDCSSV
jgi:hypothetical protein